MLAGLSAPRQLPFEAHPLNFPLVGQGVQFRTLVTGLVSPSRGPASPPTPTPRRELLAFPLQSPPKPGSQSRQKRGFSSMAK